MKSKKQTTEFNWGDALLTAIYLIIGFALIVVAKGNGWMIGLGVLFMILGSNMSEENRRHKNEREE